MKGDTMELFAHTFCAGVVQNFLEPCLSLEKMIGMWGIHIPDWDVGNTQCCRGEWGGKFLFRVKILIPSLLLAKHFPSKGERSCWVSHCKLPPLKYQLREVFGPTRQTFLPTPLLHSGLYLFLGVICQPLLNALALVSFCGIQCKGFLQITAF